jgi:hypothetical protein
MGTLHKGDDDDDTSAAANNNNVTIQNISRSKQHDMYHNL